jgi:hypothetical protein
LVDEMMNRRPHSRHTLLAACTLLGGLAGCAGAPITGYTYYDVGYMPAEYRGDLPVVVRGTPYAAPQAEFDQAVAAALQGTTFGDTTHFVAAASGPAPVYRLVIMFNPPAGVSAAALCSRPQPPDAAFGKAPAARVALIAALCRGDKAINYEDGSLATGSGPTSPEFRAGIAQIGYTLLPPYNPGDRGGTEFTS